MKGFSSPGALQRNQETSISVMIELKFKNIGENCDKHKSAAGNLWKVIFKSTQESKELQRLRKEPMLEQLAQHHMELSTALRGEPRSPKTPLMVL